MCGYEYLTDTDGQQYAVNQRTGEVTPAVTVTMPIGSYIRTPEQQRAYREHLKIEQKKYLSRKAKNDFSHFYFVLREGKLGNLSAETAARLVYLCTFLDFNGHFMKSERQRMKKADLQEVLGLSTGTTHKFWKEVTPSYIGEDSEGLILTNSDITRGTIAGSGKSYQTFYNAAIRKVYRGTKVTRHRHLGYIYQVLPLINIEYNIICWNAGEKVLDNIIPMSVAEFCEQIGYNAGEYTKLLKIYRQITFQVENHLEYFLTFVVNEADASHMRIFVNPRILYSGSDYTKVEVLGAFTKIDK